MRHTRSTCPPCDTDEDDDTVTFNLVRDKGGESLKQLAWPFDRPLRVCVATLQKEYGSELWDVCLKHKGKLVNSNHSPEEAGINQGDTVRLALLEPWAPPSKRVRVTRKDEPDDEDEGKRKRKKVTFQVTIPPSGSKGKAGGKSGGRKVRYSETPENQLLKCYMDVLVEGEMRKVLVALDTQSNCTYASDAVSSNRTWDPGEEKEVVGLGHFIVTTAPKEVTVMVQGEPVTLKGRREPGGRFRDGTHLFLSKKHM